MITGRDTLQKINDYVLQAESKIEYADREMDKLTSRLGGLRLEEAEQFQKLARFRLGEINAGHMVARLDKAHQVVQAFLEHHKHALAELENVWRLSLDGNPVESIEPLLFFSELEYISLAGVKGLSCDNLEQLRRDVGEDALVVDGYCP